MVRVGIRKIKLTKRRVISRDEFELYEGKLNKGLPKLQQNPRAVEIPNIINYLKTILRGHLHLAKKMYTQARRKTFLQTVRFTNFLENFVIQYVVLGRSYDDIVAEQRVVNAGYVRVMERNM